MGMTRAQLRLKAAQAAYDAGLKKPPTRRQVETWLTPVRSTITELLQGYVYEVEGKAYMKIPWSSAASLSRFDHGTAGLVRFLRRIQVPSSLENLEVMSTWDTDQPIAESVLRGALAELDQVAEFIRTKPREYLIEQSKLERMELLMGDLE